MATDISRSSLAFTDHERTAGTPQGPEEAALTKRQAEVCLLALGAMWSIRAVSDPRFAEEVVETTHALETICGKKIIDLMPREGAAENGAAPAVAAAVAEPRRR